MPTAPEDDLGRKLDSFTVKEILIGHIEATNTRLDRIESKLDNVGIGIQNSTVALLEHSNSRHSGSVGRAELYGALITIASVVVSAVAVLT